MASPVSSMSRACFTCSMSHIHTYTHRHAHKHTHTHTHNTHTHTHTHTHKCTWCYPAFNGAAPFFRHAYIVLHYIALHTYTYTCMTRAHPQAEIWGHKIFRNFLSGGSDPSQKRATGAYYTWKKPRTRQRDLYGNVDVYVLRSPRVDTHIFIPAPGATYPLTAPPLLLSYA